MNNYEKYFNLKMGITSQVFKEIGPFGILVLPHTLICDTFVGAGVTAVSLVDAFTDKPRVTKELFEEIGPFAIFFLPHTLIVDTASKTAQAVGAGLAEGLGLNDSNARHPKFSDIKCQKDDYKYLKITEATAIRKKIKFGAHHWSLILTIRLRGSFFTYVLLQKDSSGKIGCDSYKYLVDALNDTYGLKGTHSTIKNSVVNKYWDNYFGNYLEPKEFYRFGTKDCQEFVRRQFKYLTGYEINLGL